MDTSTQNSCKIKILEIDITWFLAIVIKAQKTRKILFCHLAIVHLSSDLLLIITDLSDIFPCYEDQSLHHREHRSQWQDQQLESHNCCWQELVEVLHNLMKKQVEELRNLMKMMMEEEVVVGESAGWSSDGEVGSLLCVCVNFASFPTSDSEAWSPS